MNKVTLGGFVLLPLVLVGCPGDGDDGDGDTGSSQGCADPSDPSAPRLSVTDDVVEDTTWTCNNIYLLDQTVVFVSDATLTIEAGTTIEGTAGSALVITDTAQINAQGTSSAPVVMTSANPVGQRSRGDWGGLVLFGQAPVNLDNGSGVAEGLLTPVSYGGMESTHNCGTLQYTRVEWAGFVISDDNELNGITFYACGSGTTVDHVQVHMGADDGIEMFGGNFDASNLVVTGAGDDSIDCDQGYQGTLTNVFIHQDPTMGDACFEWSNGSHSSTAEPLTGPTVINGTCVGSGDGNESKGATLKEGTDAGFISTLFINLTGDNIKLENLETQTRAEAGNIAIDGTIFCDGNAFSIEEEGDEDDPPPTWTAMDFADWVAAAGNNQFGVDCGLPSAAWGDPDIQPPPGSTPDGAGASPGQSYAGAVDPNGENWTREPWINYDPAG